MSITSQKKIFYAPAPSTTRGKPYLLGKDPKGVNMLYCTGSSVIIRNLRDPVLCDSYNEHSHETTVARYSPSGFYIASADKTGLVKIWDTTQAEHICKLEIKPISGPVWDIAWTDDSKRICVVGEGREKFGAVFMADAGSSVGSIDAHTKPITTCAIKQSRPYRIVTGSEDFSCNWYEGPPFKFKKFLKDFQKFVNCVRFNPGDSHWIAVSSDKTGIIYDGKDGSKTGALSQEKGQVHGGSIYAVDWSPDGSRLLTVSADKTAKLWDAPTGNCISTFTFGNDVNDQQVGCLWQGEFLVTLSLGGDFHYLDVNNPGKPTRTIRGTNKNINAVTYDPANKHIYGGDYAAEVIRWNEDNGENIRFSGKGHGNQIVNMHLAGPHLVSAGWDDNVRFSSLEKGEWGEGIPLEGQPSDIAVSGDVAVIATINGVVVCRGGKRVSKTASKVKCCSVAIHPDGKTVAVGTEENKLHIYTLNGDNLTEVKVFEDHRGAITTVNFSPDGKWLGSADAAREIFLWDVASWTLHTRDLTFHTAKPTYLAWAPDSKHFATSSVDQGVWVWGVEAPSKLRHYIKGIHTGGVTRVFWLDNNTLGTAGLDSFIKTWTLTYA